MFWIARSGFGCLIGGKLIGLGIKTSDRRYSGREIVLEQREADVRSGSNGSRTTEGATRTNIHLMCKARQPGF